MENDDNREYINIKTAILDYMGELNNGVCISITITLYDYSFQSVYWIHPDGYHTLECEENFLKLFGVTTTERLPFLKELVEDIESILPEKDDIFKEFLNK